MLLHPGGEYKMPIREGTEREHAVELGALPQAPRKGTCAWCDFRAVCGPLEEARAADIGPHDVTLMLGLLYHLENPVRVLRLARAITRKVMVIETQVVPHLSGVVDWGSWRFQRHMVGAFGIIDETDETHASEASVHGICLAPSIETLEWLTVAVLLLAVAFAIYPTTLQGGLVAVVSTITSFLSAQASSVGGS